MRRRKLDAPYRADLLRPESRYATWSVKADRSQVREDAPFHHGKESRRCVGENLTHPTELPSFSRKKRHGAAATIVLMAGTAMREGPAGRAAVGCVKSAPTHHSIMGRNRGGASAKP